MSIVKRSPEEKRERNKELRRIHYLSHKESTKITTDKYRLANSIRINAIKANPCMDCGNTYPPESMDFDHVRGEKLFQIAQSLTHKWESIQAEIDKCELICAVCHRIRTKDRRKSI